MSEPIMKLSDNIVCKYDDEYGHNEHGWHLEEGWETPFCIDKNVFCDYCITESLKVDAGRR